MRRSAMIGLVRIALQRPYTFMVMAALILIFGVMAWKKTPTDIFPDIGIPVICAVWTYNGLSPDEMSGRVIYYYERTLSAQVNDIEHIESQSLPGYGVVKIFFQPKVRIEAALAQVAAASQTVLKLLPSGITPPYVLTFNASSVPILQLALSSQTLTESQLFDYGQNFIRPQLATVKGAAIPSPFGGKLRQVQVDIDPRKLRAFGLSAQSVSDAIARQNLITPVGTQKIGALEYIVALNGAPEAVAELNDLPIKAVDGTIVYIRDVAYVHDGSPPQTNIVRVDSKRAVLMTIQKSGSASTLDVIDGVKALLPKIKDSLPKDLTLTVIGDQALFVEDAISSVMTEGLIAAALTGAMILLFLGSWRSTLIITVSIPLAVLASIAALSALGETINVMTLGGLALAVGILVDDATVTVENMNSHLEQGKEIEEAIMDGARQIVLPATVSLLCICIVFIPMFSLDGVSGYLFRPMAEAVVFALIASYVLSRTLVPTLARYLLANEHAADETRSRRTNILHRFQLKFERSFSAIRERYAETLKAALAAPLHFALVFFALVVVSFGLFPLLGQNFFPSVASDQIKLHVRAPVGLTIEEVALAIDRMESDIRRSLPKGAVDAIVDNIGLPISGINLAYSNSGAIGASDADIYISVRDKENAAAYVEMLRAQLPRRFPAATFAFLPADIVTQILNFGLPAPLDLQIIGRDAVANQAFAEQLVKRIARIPGVADQRLQQAFNAPTLKLTVDRSFATDVGLSEREIATSLQNTLAGSLQSAPTFWLDPKSGVSYPIVVQSPQYRMDSLAALSNAPFVTDRGIQLAGGLATISRSQSNAVVSHYNVQPTLDIFAGTRDRDLGAVAADVRNIVAEMSAKAPRGSTIVLRGQVETMTLAFAQLYGGLILAVTLIYLLIVVNFQSLVDPLVIVCALPSALAGIVWTLFLTRTTLSVPALTGAIMCMGVATANSILVVSFARERAAEGADIPTAALEAGVARFRPVVMTALAMIIGMAPLALSGEQNAPLGRAVIGGLCCSTVATLLLVPALFTLAHGLSFDVIAQILPWRKAAK
jgi:multidrug efflux pump subunit AcrB